MLVNSAGRGLYAAAVACFFRESLRRQLLAFPQVIAAAVAFLQCDDPLKRTRVARFYCADFFACHKKEAVFGRFVV